MHTTTIDGSFTETMHAAKELVLQPRMGFSDPQLMRAGLERVRDFNGTRIGTLTIDSFTRRRMLAEAAEAVKKRQPLNGWPICSYPLGTSRELLSGIRDAGLAVQVRHGSALPQHVFQAAAAIGIDAIEGGPISYCLPYSREPLAKSFVAWDEAARMWAAHRRRSKTPAHIESFGGCMLGQLCPPALLLAITLLEGRFFVERGIESVSFSLAQGTNSDQDLGALLTLRRIATEWFPNVDWHIVFYTYMGMFPATATGARRLIEDSARLAVQGGADRLIVKTAVEAYRIPSIDDNLTAMAWSRDAARGANGISIGKPALEFADLIEAEVRRLLWSVLRRDDDLPTAVLDAFAAGALDVPHCIHPNNRDVARAAIDPRTGVIAFHNAGGMQVRELGSDAAAGLPISEVILRGLTYNRRRYDGGLPS